MEDTSISFTQYTTQQKLLFLALFLLFFFLQLLVLPEIEPFSLGDLSIQTLFGTRTRILCGLSRGDLTITFQWLKDGIPILLLISYNKSNLTNNKCS
jgi:hypothetical protein